MKTRRIVITAKRIGVNNFIAAASWFDPWSVERQWDTQVAEGVAATGITSGGHAGKLTQALSCIGWSAIKTALEDGIDCVFVDVDPEACPGVEWFLPMTSNVRNMEVTVIAHDKVDQQHESDVYEELLRRSRTAIENAFHRMIRE